MSLSESLKCFLNQLDRAYPGCPWGSFFFPFLFWNRLLYFSLWGIYVISNTEHWSSVHLQEYRWHREEMTDWKSGELRPALIYWILSKYPSYCSYCCLLMFMWVFRGRWAFPPVQHSKSNLSWWNKTSSPQLLRVYHLLSVIPPITGKDFSSSAELQQFEGYHALNTSFSRLNLLLL